MTPSQIVHKICNSQPVDKCAEGGAGLCYVCGGNMSRGIPVTDWMTDSYTDQTRIAVPLATHVCESCCFVMGRLSPVPGRPAGFCKGCGGTGKVTTVAKKGKTKNSTIGDPCPKCEGSGQATAGGNFRNYGHMWEPGWNAPPFGDSEFFVPGYANASKGQKPLIREFLEREHAAPWFCAVANSGQKHVLPYAPINSPGRAGHALFDEVLVTIPGDTSLIGELCHLLTDGATKEELERGDYRPQTWIRIGRDRLRAFESTHGRRRGGWFSLALWLAQRDEESVALRIKEEQAEFEAKKEREKQYAKKQRTAEPARKPAGRGNRSVQGRVPASEERPPADELLDVHAGPLEVVSADQLNSCRVPNDVPAQASTGGGKQLGLFGDDETGKAMRRKRARH